MREHVFSEIDKNKDKMISLEEFMTATEDKEFKKNEEWKVADLKF
jgi:nucleobindin